MQVQQQLYYLKLQQEKMQSDFEDIQVRPRYTKISELVLIKILIKILFFRNRKKCLKITSQL